MSSRVLPALFAMLYAAILAVLLFVPFVAREYRKRGELGAWTAVLRFSALLYLCALVAYVLTPLPAVTPGFCRIYGGLRPQWVPFAGLDGFQMPRTWPELSALLAQDPILQFGLNIVLFVPLGVLLRRMFGLRMRGVLLCGFGTSLVIELTQLTGVWFYYPCPYRLFDVDDLIANTAGAAIGRLVNPALRLLPVRRGGTRPTVPRPVTRFRRLTGMCCDLLLLWWLGTIALRVADVVLRAAGVGFVWWLEPFTEWFAPAVLLLVVMLIAGSSPGQHAVQLRSIAPASRRPGPLRVLRRWLAGVGGLGLAQALLSLVGLATLWLPVTLVWCTAHVWGVISTRDHRGITGRFAGLKLIDARRLPDTPTRRIRRPEGHAPPTRRIRREAG
ncbi:VanZ family protein [Saccharopolyspora taberi]|uniref:Glycopeptide antibiotics resistance protein n=1 Tax=Saccharopolyspora taberi TaxID=60895 RepID=A0ABN3VBI9_9PSEU